MNAIYTPGFGDEATWGPCTGHPHDPRTIFNEAAEAAEDLNDAISAAYTELKNAPDAHEHPNSAEAAALDAAQILAGSVPLLSVLKGIAISRREMSEICAYFAGLVGKGMTQEQKLSDPAVSALDAAFEALGGVQ